jgi:cytochrome P450
LFGFKQIRESFEFLKSFISNQIEEHEKTLEKSNIRDYIDGYLLEMKEREVKNEKGSFSKPLLVQNVRTFFAAGSESVKVTMDWAMALMALNPSIQAMVQQELDTVVGRDRAVSWSDRPHLPYCQAVMMETQRWASVVPLNVARRVLKATTIGGYFIPKNTLVVANFWAVNRDPNLWVDPEKFDPKRFLSEDEKYW